MITSAISTGTWASIDERCPMRCKVDGNDLATVFMGDDGQVVELIFNAAGLLRLAEVSRRAVAEMVEFGPQARQQAALSPAGGES